MTSLGFSNIGRRAAVVASAVAIVSTAACSDEATAPRSAAVPAAANPGRGDAATTVVMPRIDGIAATNEWDGAAAIPLQVLLPNGSVQKGNALFTHDRQYLYMAVIFDRKSAFHATDVVGFEFDNDNDGVAEDGDDIAMMAPSSPKNVQVAGGDFHLYNGGVSLRSDVSDGGTNELVVSWGTAGTVGVFEMRKPLNSSDNAHDFSIPLSLAPWTLGVKIRVSLEADPVGSGTLTHTVKPGWTSYCKLTIHKTSTAAAAC